MKNKFFNILITCIFLVVVSCVSKFEKDQRIVQQDYTKKTAILTKSRIDSLVETLSNSCKNQDDVNKNTFENLKSKYNEISALVLQHIDGKVIKTLPEEFDTSEINTTYLSKEMIKLFRKNKNIQILPNILENRNKYLCLLIPLNDKNQNLTNIISVFLDSKSLFEPIEKKSFFSLPYSLCIINENKTILYDTDYNKIGRDFTYGEKSYPIIALKALFKKMMENDVDYYITSSIKKDAKTEQLYTWYSISIPAFAGTKWWITLTRNIRKSQKKKSTDVYLLSTLRSYTVKDTLIDAILDNDSENIRKILTEIYQLNPQIYSVQLVNSQGKVISGIPPENCAIGYSYTMKKNESYDNAIKDILIDKKEKIITSPLIEGGNGKFTFMPIIINKEIIGVLYSIEIVGLGQSWRGQAPTGAQTERKLK